MWLFNQSPNDDPNDDIISGDLESGICGCLISIPNYVLISLPHYVVV